ncbi:hypothetical protein PRIPAC_89038 [Pristionchus pacificus]|nr:hypothetical protein PRIPAC_89038 [Pristionchus pacificus]
MGLTKDYLRYVHAGACNAVGSANGCVVAIDTTSCAVAACDNVNIYNMRTTEKVAHLENEKKTVTAIRMCAAKKYLAIGYNDGSLRLYDRTAEDQRSFISLIGHRSGVNCIAFSNDGLTVATGGKDSSIVIWDIVAETGIVRLHGHKDSITHLQFTQNDRFLVSSSKDTYVKLWHVESHSCFYTISDHRSEVYSFALLKHDSLLVTASAELELLVFDVHWIDGGAKQSADPSDPSSKKAKQEEEMVPEREDDLANRYVRVSLRGRLLRQSTGRALQLCVSADERLLLCLGSGQLVDIFRVYTEEETAKRVTKKLRKAKRKAAESKDSTAPTVDDVAQDVTTKIGRIGEYRAMRDKVKWADFAPLATEGTVTVRKDVEDEEGEEEEGKGEGERREEGRAEEGKKKEQSKYTYTAFILCKSNTVQSVAITVDLETNETRAESVANLDKLGHREDVRSLAVSSNNAAYASGGGSQVIVWSMRSLKPQNTLREIGMDDVTAVIFATGDNHVVVGTKSGSLFLFVLGSAECIEVKRSAHEAAIWQIVPTPDKKGFVTCSADKSVKFWSYQLIDEGPKKRLSIRETRVLTVPDEALCVAVSPDGRFLLVGLLNSTVSVYFMDTLKFFLSLYGHSLPVTSVTVSPDSKLAVSGSADKTIKIWGLDFGDCHKSFHAHDEPVSCVLFSPSNEEEMLVWSAGRDGKIKQWDAVKRERVQVLHNHTAEVRALAQNGEGSVMLSASHDRSIRCWELTEEIIVLEEEEAIEREEQFDAKFLDEDDVVAGETRVQTGEDPEKSAIATMAAAKNKQSIASTEQICEAVEIARKERDAEKEDDYQPHPLVKALGSSSLSHFLVDVVSRVQPSNLERALVMVPFGFVPDLLEALAFAVKKHYKLELATRVALYLLRIHHTHVTNSPLLLPIVDGMRKLMPEGINTVRHVYGVNLAALKMLQREYEEQQEERLFDESAILNPKLAKKKAKKTRKAIVKAVKN